MLLLVRWEGEQWQKEEEHHVRVASWGTDVMAEEPFGRGLRRMRTTGRSQI